MENSRYLASYSNFKIFEFSALTLVVMDNMPTIDVQKIASKSANQVKEIMAAVRICHIYSGNA